MSSWLAVVGGAQASPLILPSSQSLPIYFFMCHYMLFIMAAHLKLFLKIHCKCRVGIFSFRGLYRKYSGLCPRKQQTSESILLIRERTLPKVRARLIGVRASIQSYFSYSATGPTIDWHNRFDKGAPKSASFQRSRCRTTMLPVQSNISPKVGSRVAANLTIRPL